MSDNNDKKQFSRYYPSFTPPSNQSTAIEDDDVWEEGGSYVDPKSARGSSAPSSSNSK